MANTTKTKSSATKAQKPTVESEKFDEPVVEKAREKLVSKDVDIHEYIPVLSGVHGKLIYISPRTGERFVWEEFGEEQYIELQELKNAKSANKKFYERNWFMFNDEYSWVIDYLGVGAFYKNALSVDNFDDLFEKKPEEIAAIVKKLSKGQKSMVAYRARQLLSEDKIDSRRVIDALEKALDVELVER